MVFCGVPLASGILYEDAPAFMDITQPLYSVHVHIVPAA